MPATRSGLSLSSIIYNKQTMEEEREKPFAAGTLTEGVRSSRFLLYEIGPRVRARISG